MAFVNKYVSDWKWVTRITQSNFWQAAFIRPFPPGRDRWKTRAMSLLSYVFGCFFLIPVMTASLINDSMQRFMPLNEMPSVNGILVDIRDCFRCRQYFIVRGSDDNSYLFMETQGNLIKLKPYMGTAVTVWYQKSFWLPTFDYPKFFSNDSYEVRLENNNRYLHEYEGHWRVYAEKTKNRHIWHLCWLIFGILLPVLIIWKYWRANKQ